MSWCGEQLVLGYRRQYVLLNVSTAAVSEVATTGASLQPAITKLTSGEVGRQFSGPLHGKRFILACCGPEPLHDCLPNLPAVAVASRC